MTLQKISIGGDCNCEDADSNQELISVQEGMAFATSLARPVTERELLGLGDAVGRVLAIDILAPRPSPNFDNSAMDGYAVNTRNFEGSGPWNFPVVAEISAGKYESCGFDNNSVFAARIFTGAVVPGEFDAVIMQEKCSISSGAVHTHHKPVIGENIRYKGSNSAIGSSLITAHTMIEPRHIGLLAANGISSIEAFRAVRVGVFSTGDELVSPLQNDAELEEGQIFDANKAMLSALLVSAGANVTDLGVVPDDLEKCISHFKSLKDQFDIVISSGAVSVGDHDYVKLAFEKAGGSINLWRIAIKPGKPIMFGRIGKTLFTGLPGNPFAVFVGYHQFAKSQILLLSGLRSNSEEPMVAESGFNWQRKTGRQEFFPAKITGKTSDGKPILVRLGAGSSADLHPLGEADGLGVVNADQGEICKGQKISWFRFNSRIMN